MVRTRKVLALVCIVAIVVAAFGPAASQSPTAVLIPLGPLFGAVTSTRVPPAHIADLPAAPTLSVRSLRAPPRA
jgi:hypothetical protein